MDCKAVAKGLSLHFFIMVHVSGIVTALALVSTVVAQCGSGTPDATVTVS